jgi:UDP-N-acetylmuramoyl-tripeptide--D-alanyl-D-alanine ligase
MKPLLLNEIKNILRAELKTPYVKGSISGVSIDSRSIKSGDLFVAIGGENHDGHDYMRAAIAGGAKAVLIEKNLPVPEEAHRSEVCVMKVENCVSALGDLARHYRRSLKHGLTVIAITGSNGKTTTREMLYHVLSKHKTGYRSPKNYNNQLGVPLTIFGVEPEHDFAVVEIATNAPGEIAALSRIAEPDVAIITSVAASHLDGLKDIDGVSVEKISIVAGMSDRGVVICGRDHLPTLERLRPLDVHTITFGFDENADISALQVNRSDSGVSFSTNDHCEIHLPLLGRHNVGNALAALAAVRRMGLTSEDFAEAMGDFSAVKQRMAVSHVNGITIIDDSYNANPHSTAAALEELTSHTQAKRRVLILGDMNELGPESEAYHQQLGRDIAESNVNLLLTVGPLAAITANTALQTGMGLASVQRSINSRRMARLVKSLLLDEDLVLVKGSRGMQMEKVVESLNRYKRKTVIKKTGYITVPSRKRKSTPKAQPLVR